MIIQGENHTSQMTVSQGSFIKLHEGWKFNDMERTGLKKWCNLCCSQIPWKSKTGKIKKLRLSLTLLSSIWCVVLQQCQNMGLFFLRTLQIQIRGAKSKLNWFIPHTRAQHVHICTATTQSAYVSFNLSVFVVTLVELWDLSLIK